MKNKYPVLSGFLKMRRGVLKLTQKELGKVIGISQHGVGLLERGVTMVKDSHFSLLADKLNVKTQDLYFLKEIDMMLSDKCSD